MTETNWAGCVIPSDVLYDLEADVWVRFEGDEAIVGMTDIAQTRCGKLVQVSWKKPGVHIKRGRPLAVIESSKWVGPFESPLSGDLVSNNEWFQQDVAIANKDPYGFGWLVRLKPTDLESEKQNLVNSEVAFAHYKKVIDENNIRCFRCSE